MSSENGAAYFTITSDETDALIAVSVDPEIAAEAQIHETSMVDGHDESMDEGMEEMDDMESGGEVMQMVHLERLDLPAGETVELAPGGYHIMLLDLAEPLASGDSFELTLNFETADDTVITVAVSDTAPE